MPGLFERLLRGLGLAPRTFAEIPSGAAFLHGKDEYAFAVMAARQFQDNLRVLVPEPVGSELDVIATLAISRPGRPTQESVTVAIDDTIVGYCPSYLAVQLRSWVDQWRLHKARIACRARIHSTRDKHGRPGMLVVSLDVALPLRMTVLEDEMAQ